MLMDEMREIWISQPCHPTAARLSGTCSQFCGAADPFHTMPSLQVCENNDADILNFSSICYAVAALTPYSVKQYHNSFRDSCNDILSSSYSRTTSSR